MQPEKTLSSPEKSQVALVRCENYDPANVAAAVRKGIGLLGGIARFIKPGEKIVLKPNLLSAHAPEENVTTHPAVVGAVAKLLQENGVKVSAGDSPPRGHFNKIFNVSGMQAVVGELGLEIADFENGQTVSSPNGHRNKQFTIADGILQADGMFGLPKLKTHHLTRITGAVKNQYGCIPGILKPAMHVALPDVDEFSKMLVDLNICLATRLFILDAIEAMDGNGPTSGSTFHLNLLAFSIDPVALDSTICRLIHLEPEMVRTNYWGAEFGFGKMDSEKIEILGERLETFDSPEFKVQRQPQIQFNTAWKYRRLKHFITNRPIIDVNKCRKCGECVDQCPQMPKALSWNKKAGKPPEFDYGLCIRCFCCQEVCPFKAIDVHVPLVRRFVDKIYTILYGA